MPIARSVNLPKQPAQHVFSGAKSLRTPARKVGTRVSAENNVCFCSSERHETVHTSGAATLLHICDSHMQKSCLPGNGAALVSLPDQPRSRDRARAGISCEQLVA
jgi:hypothetical protein